jgi:fibronectin-binding autotransporter adhesin
MRKVLLAGTVLLTSKTFAVSVSNYSGLYNAIINPTSPTDNITFTASINLSNSPNYLRPLNTTNSFDPSSGPNYITMIDGAGFNLVGTGGYAGIYVRGQSTTPIPVTIQNLIFSSCTSQGGNGGSSPTGPNGSAGGGGAGLGGGLFVEANANVILINSAFSNCAAVGGAGGSSSGVSDCDGGGGGGGGRGNAIAPPNGGPSPCAPPWNGSGGGGYAYPGSSGGGGGGAGSSASVNGGNNFGGTGGGIGGNTPNATANGAGGGRGGDASGTQATGVPGGQGGFGSSAYGGGGGGGGRGTTFGGGNGGAGAFLGGGGGGGLGDGVKGGNGGAGGFGGGGGGGGAGPAASNGGNGGFGGGGGGAGYGGSGTGTRGSGGAFGGNGGVIAQSGAPGGGGAGLGGAIFLHATASRAAALTISGSCTFLSNTVTGGAAGSGPGSATAGQARGADIFMMSSSTLTFDNLNLSSVVVASNIESDGGAGGGSTSTGGIIKSGVGTLALTGINTYTGSTACNGGILQVSADNNLGAAANTLSFNGGTLAVGSGFSTSRSITLNAFGGTVDVATGSATIGSAITGGATTFTKSGAGTLALSGTGSNYSGLSISGGTLRMGASNILPTTVAVSLGGGVLDLNNFSQTIGPFTGTTNIALGSATLTSSFSSGSFSYSGVISGTGSLTKSGAGTLILGGINTYTGSTACNGGILRVSADNNLGAAANTFSFNGGTLTMSTGFSTARSTTLNAVGGTVTVTSGTGIFTGAMTGAGAFTLGGGTLAFATTTKAYTGGTVISGGTLQMNTTSVMPSTGDVTLSGGTFNLNSFNQTIAKISGSSNITLGSAALTTSFTGSSTYSGVISDTGSLIKSGTGTLILSGANSYTGGTTISGGILQMGIANALSSTGDVTLSGGVFNLNSLSQSVAKISGSSNITLGSAALTTNFTGSSTYSGIISDTGALTKSGTGTLTLSGANSYTGGTTISGGILQMGIANALSSTGDVTLSGGVFNLNSLSQSVAKISGSSNITLGSATLTTNFTGSSTYSGIISDTGALTKSGTGTLTLSGANSYTGGTTISGGILQMGIANALSSTGDVTLSGGVFNLNSLSQSVAKISGSSNITLGSATLTTNFTGSSTYSGIISDTGALTKSGTGTLTLSGANSYTGGTTISGGILQMGIANALASTGDVTLSGGVFDLNSLSQSIAKISGSSNITLGAAALTTNFTGSSTYSGAISGTGSLIKSGIGTLILLGANSYTGGTTISGGILQMGIANALASTGDVTLSGGVFNLNSFNQSVAKISGSSNITLGSAALTTNFTGSSTFSGIISDTGSLTKSGTGTLILSGANSYTGGTTISGGILQMGVANALASTGDVTLSGGIFDLNSFSQSVAKVAGSSDINLGSATLTTNFTGSSTYSGVISGSGSLTKSGTGMLILGGANTYTGSTACNGGILQVSADSNLGAAANTLSFNGGTLAMSTGISTARSITLNGGGATISVTSGTGVFTGTMTGSGALTLNGGTLAFGTNAKGYTGGTVISGGILQMNAATMMPSNGDIALSGGVFSLNSFSQSVAKISGSSNITLGSAALTTNFTGSSTYSGAISGTGSFTKSGTGTLILSGANSYTGGTTISDGILQMGVANALASTGDVTLSGGVFNLNSFSQSVAKISGSSNITLGSATLTTSFTGSSTFSGIISDTGSLTKSGTGTLILSGANSYTGGTTISGGILQIGIANALASTGDVTLSSGTFDLNNLNQAVAKISGSSNITLGSAALTTSFTGSSTYSGVIAGTGSLTKSSTGTLTLSGANSYTGGTTISGGILQMGVANALASTGDVTLSGGVLDLNSFTQSLAKISGSSNITLGSAALTTNFTGSSIYSGLISGTGSLTKSGTGTLILSGGNSYTGGTTISGGILQMGIANALASTGDVTLSSGTFNLNNLNQSLAKISGSSNITLGSAALTTSFTGSSTYSGVISGTGSLTKSSTGTLTLSGANSYTGGTTISGGILQMGIANALVSTGDVTLSGGVFDLNGFGQSIAKISGSSGITLGAAALTTDFTGSSTYSGVIAGTGSLTKSGTGTLTLSGANSYTGGTTISGGILQMGIANALVSTGDVALSGGVFDLNSFTQSVAKISGSSNITLGSAALTTNFTGSSTYSGVISGTGSLTKSSTGTLTLSGANSYTGGTTISGGILQMGIANALASTGDVTLSGGVFDLNSFNQSVAKISGFSNITLGSAALTTDFTGSSTYSGVISGTGSLTISGTGTFILSGNNSYTGGTTISGGILQIGIANALASTGDVTLSGGVFDLNSFNQSVAKISGSSNITLGSAALTTDFTGSSTYSGVISGMGSLTKSGTGTLIYTGAASNTYTGLTTISAGTLQLNKGNNVSAITGDIVINGGTLQLSAANQIADTSNVTLNSGTWSLSGNNTTVSSLTFNGGTYTPGTATLSLSSTSTALAMGAQTIGGQLNLTGDSGGDLVFNQLSGTATLTDLNLGSVTRLFNVINPSAITTITGIVSNGGFIKQGAGTLILTNSSNSYGGTTNLDTGVTQISAGGQFGVGDLVFNGGTLEATAGAALTNNITLTGAGIIQVDTATLSLSGTITSSGSLTKTGPGILQLAGGTANSYSGLININAGELSLAKTSGAATTGQVSLNNGAALSLTSNQEIGSLVFNSDGTYSSTATLALSSTGTALTMQGGATTTGDIQLLAGDVVFDATNDGTATINHISLGGANRTFTIGDGSAAYDMQLDGSTSTGGGLIKEGTGTLLLAGTHTLAGSNSAVNGGRLAVSGTLTCNTLAVASGALLTGTGTINADMTLSGDLRPGASIGTIYLIGNQVFGSSSIVQIEFDTTQTDIIDITGNLTIQPGATLQLIPTPANYPNDFVYTPITTTGVITGNFSQVTSSYPLFTGVAKNVGNAIILEAQRLPFTALVPTGNAGAVATYLDTLNPSFGSDLYSVLTILEQTPSAAALTVDLLQMQPSMLKGLALSQENNGFRIQSLIQRRLENSYQITCNHPCTFITDVWGDMSGDVYAQHSIESEPGFRSQTAEGVAGVNFRFCDLLFGAAAGYGSSSLLWKTTEGKIRSEYGSLYASWKPNYFFVEAITTAALSHYKESRAIHFSTIDRQAHASFKGWSMTNDLMVGAYLPIAGFDLLTYISMNYTYLFQNRFRESGAESLNLIVNSSSYHIIRNEGSLTLSKSFDIRDSQIIINGKCAYIREQRFKGDSYRAKFIDTKGGFTVKGMNPSRNIFSPGLTVTFAQKPTCWYGSLSYNAEIAPHLFDQNISLQFDYKF